MVAECSISSSSSSSSPPPRKWVKGNAIGAGAFGVVNLAMDTSTGELFVVKSSSSETQFEALENEANILKGINSPHIVQCLGSEVLCENGVPKLNLFMEYMAGGSLTDITEKFGKALDESIIRLYTKEILRGLDYLHKNGIVHCDLKCKNVLLGSTGNIKLADFGCARKLGFSKTNISWQSICGTPLWMAPEVLRNEGLDFAADIWSLGCTVIEMITGRLPWADDVSNPLGAVFKIAFRNELPKFPENLSKEGLDFLDKCLQRDPKMRCSAEELLGHPFVTGNNSTKGAAWSPGSVLDVAFSGSDNESDGVDSSNEETPCRVPFSSRRPHGPTRLSRRRSDNWVTVRG